MERQSGQQRELEADGRQQQPRGGAATTRRINRVIATPIARIRAAIAATRTARSSSK
jgi:hypothetical protein